MIKFGSRRGISSIVGSMFFLILMTSGFSVYILSIQSQTDLVDTQQKVADTQIRKIQENYAISATTDTNDNNRLAIQVKNQGPFPLEVADIWIINKTDAVNGYPAERHLLNSTDSFIPIGYGKNILENKPLYMNPDEYDIKVISTVGTIRQTDIDVNGNDDLKVELFAIPPDVRIGENVTIAMRVTNVGDIDIENVVPFGAPIVNPPSAVLSSEIVSAPSIDLLKQTESGFFTWHYTVTGTVGNKVSFTNNASGTIMSTYTVESNNDSDKIILRDDEGGSGDLIVLTQDLLARPEIFLTIPSSQGDSGSKSLWGVNVVNPTNATMEVTKLTITAFAPGANNNDKIFAPSCLPEDIAPGGGNEWNCPSENLIMWQDRDDPVIIPAYSVSPFLVKILPGSISGQNILESIIVQSTIFTTAGSFGKAGYQTTMYDPTDMVGNVYLSDVKDSRNNLDIKSTRSGIPDSSVQTFKIVFADMDNDDVTFVKPGARLIINVPSGWTDVVIDDNSGFDVPPVINNWSDNSTQIIATTSDKIGDAANVADTITFNATAPDVNNKQLYVMYVLADGETDNNFAIGPLTEIILQVVP